MDHCDECTIDDKLYICCGRYPETGVSVEINLKSGQKVYACPYLNIAGKCTIYDRRPIGCREYYCSRYKRITGIGGEYMRFLTDWDINLIEEDHI